jgi:mRNA deadenylase 3'-5' endonuclease subunit Ccr4
MKPLDPIYKPAEEMIEAMNKLPKFKSAYDQYTNLHPELSSNEWLGEPKFTNYTEWIGTLDYIMLRQDKHHHLFELQRILRLPDEKDCQPGLPNQIYSSDHLCIMAEYKLNQ